MARQKSSRPAADPARRWLHEKLDSALAEGCTMWVLVGEPGVGKSDFLRSLAERFPGSPRIEIRRPLGTHRPEGFWAALLGQLDLEGSRVPEPAHEAARWAADLLPPGNGGRRLVLVDALERAPALVDSSGFPGLDRALPGVAVVITSRPGRHLDALSAGGATLVHLEARSAENMADLERWLEGRMGSRDMVEVVASHSEGNFLVAGHLAAALKRGEMGVHDLDAIPAGLESALAALWDEILDLAPEELHEDLVRVACALSEAGETLPAASLADFLNLPASRVRDVLVWLRPILRYRDGGYRLFHRRMDDFLSRRFRRDLVRVHEQVISFFREAYPSWEEMDDRYGWFYLGHHCDRFARTARRRDFSVLHWLGEGPFIKAKLAHTRSLKAVLEDLCRCLRAALEERDLPRIVSYSLRIPRLRAREAAEGMHELADLGRFDLARERARLLRRESSRLMAFLLLAWQAAGEGDLELARSLVAEARAVMRPDLPEDDAPLFLAMVADLGRSLTAEEVLPLLSTGRLPARSVAFALRLARQDVPEDLRLAALEEGVRVAAQIEEPAERDWALQSLARELKARGQGRRAKQVFKGEVPERAPDPEGMEEPLKALRSSKEGAAPFRAALEVAAGVRWEPRRVAALAALAAELPGRAAEDWAGEAFELLSQVVVQIQNREERARALAAVLRAAGRRPRAEGWRPILDRLAAAAETLEDGALRARSLGQLALARHEARELRPAQETISQAAALAFAVEDPEERGRLLAMLAGVAAATGRPARARDLAFHSLQAVESPAPQRIDVETRSALAMGVAAAVPRERSLELFQTSANAAREIPDLRLRANLLSALAQGLARLGEEEWARRLQDQAVGAARAMEPGASQALTLATLALQEASWGDLSRAEQVVKEAAEAARAEASAAQRAEALLAVAAARRSAGDESGAQQLIKQVLADLERLPAAELAGALALRQAAGLVRETRLVDTVLDLLRRGREGLEGLSGRPRDEGLGALLQSYLALDRLDEARSALSALEDGEARVHGRLLLARALIRQHPEEALDLLARIPVFEERMRGVRECTVELVREVLPSGRDRVLDTLTELTVLAVEDEATADVLAGRWVNLVADRKAIVDSLRKLGYPLEDLLAGRLPEPSDA